MDNKYCKCKTSCADNKCLCFDNNEYCCEDCKCYECDNLRVTLKCKQFVEDCINTYYLRVLQSYNNAPEDIKQELKIRLDEQSNQTHSLTEYDINEIEEELPVDLPPALIAYLLTKFRIRIEWHEFILSEDPNKIIDLMRDKTYWKLGYLLFASGPCGDPVFFDFSQQQSDREFPVITINHDLAPYDCWDSREKLLPYAEEVAPTFMEFLYALCKDTLCYKNK